MKFFKKIITDIAGVVLIILAVLLGWIPGPGFVPLFLAGLGLLSINHDWAKRILKNFKENGIKIFETIFNEHRVLMIVYDIAAVSMVVGGVLLFGEATKQLWQTIIIVTIFVGLGIFLSNRKRTQRIVNYFRKENKE